MGWELLLRALLSELLEDAQDELMAQVVEMVMELQASELS